MAAVHRSSSDSLEYAGMHSSLFEVVALRARQQGQTIAAVDMISDRPDLPRNEASPQASITYTELHERAEQLSAALFVRLGATRGDAGAPVLGTKMRRGIDWYCLFCAAARLQLPLVALSVDLPDKAAEQLRNAEILEEHTLGLLVVDGSSTSSSALLDDRAGGVPSCSFAQLVDEAHLAHAPLHPETTPTATLCFSYTGGTTKASRCVRITHEMALHEVSSYPQVTSLGHADRVLQQHSVYWAASAYGEIDIALAFGCALVFCEAWDAEGLATAIRESSATCAGLVPSILATLEPGEVPSLRVIFTWGEALQARVVRDWVKHAQVIDLLISTEVWLSLYADWSSYAWKDVGGGRPAFQSVQGTCVQVRDVEGVVAHGDGAAGELLIAGPMVSPGYIDERHNKHGFADISGQRWYCTKDCVEMQTTGGLVFTGRADDLVKVGGVWVDVRELEQRLEEIEVVKEARILNRVAFVVLRAFSDGAMHALRKALPPDFVLLVLPSLPRLAGTDKVDRKRLGALSSPKNIERYEAAEAKQSALQLAELRRWYMPLAILVILVIIRTLLAFPRSEPIELSTVVIWSLPFGVYCLWEFCWRFACHSYIVLFVWESQRAANWLHEFPFGAYGFAVAIVTFLWSYWPVVFALPGMYHAYKRKRLMAWPLVAAVGFPIWARESGKWWTAAGCSGVARFYYLSLRRSECRRQKAAWLKVKKIFGLVKQCKHCAEIHAKSFGHIDLAVDKFWYCNNCWQLYDKHEECTKCKSWSVNGARCPETGAWVCTTCKKKSESEVPPGTPGKKEQAEKSENEVQAGKVEKKTQAGESEQETQAKRAQNESQAGKAENMAQSVERGKEGAQTSASEHKVQAEMSENETQAQKLTTEMHAAKCESKVQAAKSDYQAQSGPPKTAEKDLSKCEEKDIVKREMSALESDAGSMVINAQAGEVVLNVRAGEFDKEVQDVTENNTQADNLEQMKAEKTHNMAQAALCENTPQMEKSEKQEQAKMFENQMQSDKSTNEAEARRCQTRQVEQLENGILTEKLDEERPTGKENMMQPVNSEKAQAEKLHSENTAQTGKFDKEEQERKSEYTIPASESKNEGQANRYHNNAQANKSENKTQAGQYVNTAEVVNSEKNVCKGSSDNQTQSGPPKDHSVGSVEGRGNDRKIESNGIGCAGNSTATSAAEAAAASSTAPAVEGSTAANQDKREWKKNSNNGNGGGNNNYNRWGKKRPVMRREIALTDQAVAKLAKEKEASDELAKLKQASEDVGSSMCQKLDDIQNGVASVEKCPTWHIIERATGWTFSSRGDSLYGLDSLRSAKMVSALRREVGVRLSRQELNRCKSLGELLGVIAEMPSEPRTNSAHSRMQVNSAVEVEGESLSWAIMWNSKCHWTLHRDQPLSERALRVAVEALMLRHVALRAKLEDRMSVFSNTQMAFSFYEMCRRRPWWNKQNWFIRVMDWAVRWGFRHAWPRICTKACSQSNLPLTVFPNSSNMDEAQKAMWKLPEFKPPFQVGFAPFGEGTQKGALVHLAVTHMLSDGYSIIPLLADLAHFVHIAESSDANTLSVASVLSSLPPVPSAFHQLEARILRTVQDDQSLSDIVTCDPIGRSNAKHREVTTEIAVIPAHIVTAVQHAAKLLAVSDDIMMLTALGITLAQFQGVTSTNASMVVPQRDGLAESDMIGLFADIRHFSIDTENMSYLGVALHVHYIVKERLWRAPPVLTQFDVPFINFEWTDFARRHGFTQLVYCRQGPEQLSNPVKVAVDQPDPSTWRMRTAFDGNVYSDADRDRFFHLFREHLSKLLTEPMSLV